MSNNIQKNVKKAVIDELNFKKTSRSITVKLSVIAMLSALSTTLMYLQIPLPFMPPFIKLDFSELPAVIAAFVFGPLSGVIVCFLKNLMHLLVSDSMFIGEVSNFILGSCLVVIAGLVYKKKPTYKGAIIGSALGALVMAIASIFSNYYIVYPMYTMAMPMETIIGMYKTILPSIDNLWQALLIFNFPFTLCKAILSSAAAIALYRPLATALNKIKRNFNI